MTPRIWIGLDPSIAAFGWAAMRQFQGGQPDVIDLGTWSTKKDQKAGALEDVARRVDAIAGQLLKLIDDHHPREAFVESLVLGGPRKGMLATSVLGRVRGVVEGVCKARGIRLAEVRPDVLKLAVTGHRDASKEQVARVLSRFYPYPKVLDADTNATDALSAAHVGAHRFRSGYRLEANVVRYTPPSESDELDF